MEYGAKVYWILQLSVPFQSFGGEELYPTIPRKAARLCYGCIKNHIFLDGMQC